MNLGDKPVTCGQLLPKSLGVSDRRIESIAATSIDASIITLGGSDLSTTLTNLAGGSATADWSLITNKPANLVDWTQDQGDTNINANNIPLLNYAPNALASNGTAGLSSYNFTEGRKNKLAGIAEGAEVNVQSDWDETNASSDAYILNKPTNLQQSLTINNTFSSTFNGVFYLSGGLDLTNGTLSYIPQQVAGVYAPLISPTFTGTVVLPNTTSIGAVSATELGYLDGVTSAIQTQLDGKQATLSGTADVPGLDTALAGKQATIGYVPANKAGDTLTGNLNLTTTTSAATSTLAAGNLTLSSTSSPSIEVETTGVGLYISRNSGAQQGRIYNSSSGDHSLTIDAYSDAAGSGSNMGIQFRTGGGNDRMKITYDGNIGIGTTTPSRKLHVNGAFQCTDATVDSLTTAEGITVGSQTWPSTSAGHVLSFARPVNSGYNGTAFKVFAISQHSSNTLQFEANFLKMRRLDSSNGTRMYIYRVDASIFHNASDDRLKEGETPIQDALQTVRKLRPVEYDMATERGSTEYVHQAGFIAQEVQEIVELAHAVDEGDDILSLQYNTIFTYAVAALQELDATVQSQATQLSAQTARLDALEARLARLTDALT